MCKLGNQTIYQGCREELRKQGHTTNKDMRESIKKRGGCLAVLDKKP